MRRDVGKYLHVANNRNTKAKSEKRIIWIAFKLLAFNDDGGIRDYYCSYVAEGDAKEGRKERSRRLEQGLNSAKREQHVSSNTPKKVLQFSTLFFFFFRCI